MPTPLEEELLKQRLGVRAKLGALSGQVPSLAGMQPASPPQTAVRKPFMMGAVDIGGGMRTPPTTDPGLVDEIQRQQQHFGKMSSKQPGDIELPESLAELMMRAKALEGGR